MRDRFGALIFNEEAIVREDALVVRADLLADIAAEDPFVFFARWGETRDIAAAFDGAVRKAAVGLHEAVAKKSFGGACVDAEGTRTANIGDIFLQPLCIVHW